MRRKAGEIIKEYLREGQLQTNRSKPIGAGTYGVVYASDVPGNVIKQSHEPDGVFAHRRSLEDEVNTQAIAAEMGIAPKVAGLEKFPGGIGNRIEMRDVRNNFEPVDPFRTPNQDLRHPSFYAAPGSPMSFARQNQTAGMDPLFGRAFAGKPV